MQYYNSEISKKLPKLYKYFYDGITDPNKNIGHCILLWGADITVQCELALEIARILNCTGDKSPTCDCLNCRWIKDNHPAVKIYTRFDYKDSNDSVSEDGKQSGTKNISISQAKQIISELSISSDYYRVYIFCDRDKDGNLLPLNQINFPSATSNSLLKTFEEPPKNTMFIFLTNSPSDIISTVVSRSQAFFVATQNSSELNYQDVSSKLKNYWQIQRDDVVEFETMLTDLSQELGDVEMLTQFQNYILSEMEENFSDKVLYYRFLEDIKHVETAIRQLNLSPAMQMQTVLENLAFNLILK